MKEIALSINDLSFRFKEGRFAINDMNLKIENGEKVSIIGPNGSGKTTLLKLILGTLEPLKGSVSLYGREIKKMSRREIAKSVSYVPQFIYPMFEMIVLDFVMLGAYVREEEEECLKDEAWMWLKKLGLSQMAERNLFNLSAGELQKAVIAQSLLQGAKTILLDEPTAHLDLRWQKEIMELIQEISREKNMTVVAVLHDVNAAFRDFERIICIKQGRIACQEKPDGDQIIKSLEEIYEIKLKAFKKNGEILISF